MLHAPHVPPFPPTNLNPLTPSHPNQNGPPTSPLRPPGGGPRQRHPSRLRHSNRRPHVLGWGKFDSPALSWVRGDGRFVHRTGGGERVRGCCSARAAGLHRAVGALGWVGLGGGSPHGPRGQISCNRGPRVLLLSRWVINDACPISKFLQNPIERFLRDAEVSFFFSSVRICSLD